jgi:predicted ester cyclase/heme-degrading monooxygenase HmoA
MYTASQNKETVRRLYEEYLNKNDHSLLPALISGSYTGPGGLKGPDGFAAPVLALIKAFPGIRWQINELLAEGDKVAISWTWTGVHSAAFNQFEASGRNITNDGMAIYELKAGKIISSRLMTDRLGFLQQMEAIPADLNRLTGPKVAAEQVCFIDKFLVPAAAVSEFRERMKQNRELIRSLPGFIEDAAYEYTDDKDNLVCVTIANWASKEAVDQARIQVQEAYKKQGFDLRAMMKRLHITMERGLYRASAG